VAPRSAPPAKSAATRAAVSARHPMAFASRSPARRSARHSTKRPSLRGTAVSLFLTDGNDQGPTLIEGELLIHVADHD
jgi:hypothetical protein